MEQLLSDDLIFAGAVVSIRQAKDLRQVVYVLERFRSSGRIVGGSWAMRKYPVLGHFFAVPLI